MACAHPFLKPYKKGDFFIPSSPSNYIPCGYCLNCRVDKQNELTDRCEQELIDFKCGSFVTVTYDDYHIENKMRTDSSGNLVATLSKKDVQKYLYRLRQNIKRNMPDTLLSNHHFKVLYVGEYGGDGQVFDRPHVHLLFFGLDFAVCKNIITKSWNEQGIVEVDPILQGGIPYVLKYLDKQLFGKQAEEKYDKNNLERPFQNHSLGLGSSIFKNQENYIRKSKGMYRWKGKDRPVPTYYKNKYLIEKDRIRSYRTQYNDFVLHNNRPPKNWYDLHDYQIKKAGIREENINIRLQQKGRPRYDFLTLPEKQSLSEMFISELASNALLSLRQVS